MNAPDQYRGPLWERIVAVTSGLLVLFVVLYVVVRNEPFADPNIVLLLRIFVSVAAAILGTTIPGFLDVQWNFRGLAIRAVGASALFVITFFGTPHVIQPLPKPQVQIDQPVGQRNGETLELTVPFRAANLHDGMELVLEVWDNGSQQMLRNLQISPQNWNLPSVSLEVKQGWTAGIIVKVLVRDRSGVVLAQSHAREFRLTE